jgi:hypothetical protein
VAKVRIKNIGDYLFVSLDNKSVSKHSKENVSFSVENHTLKMLDSDTEVFSESTKDIIEPKEVSPLDLMILLEGYINTPGAMEEKQVSGDYTLTNSDANYLILWDLSGGSATMKLPPDAQAGLTWKVKDIGYASAGSNEGTVSGNGRNIEGVATAPVIDTPYEARWMYLSETLGEYLFE